jgi:hypothetical protein
LIAEAGHSVSIFPGKKFPGKREEIKKPGNPGISRLNREIFAISRDFPSREFPGTNTRPGQKEKLESKRGVKCSKTSSIRLLVEIRD